MPQTIPHVIPSDTGNRESSEFSEFESGAFTDDDGESTSPYLSKDITNNLTKRPIHLMASRDETAILF
jgi:hypothetical protein